MANPTSARHEISGAILWTATGLLIFVLQFNIGTPPAGPNLDPSWSAVLAWAVSNGAVWGRDVVFTYGPLGFLYPGASYYGATFDVFFAGQVVLSLILSFALVHALLFLHWPARIAFLLVFLAWWLPWISPDVTWLLFFGTSAIALSCQSEHGSGDPKLVAVACIYSFAVAVLALIKFSMVPLALLWVSVVSMTLIRHGNRMAAVAVIVTCGASWLLLWTATGQPLSGIGQYLSTSIEVSSGYAGAMGLAPPMYLDVVGFGVMASAGAWLAWNVLVLRKDATRAATFFLLGCIVYVAWRAGFTRADGHVVILFPVAFCLALASLALRAASLRQAHRTAFAAIVVLVSILSFKALPEELSPSLWSVRFKQVPQKVSYLLAPSSLRSFREAQRAERATTYSLPKIKAIVGTASTDLLSWDQGVLLLNDLNYRPRPVFQGYSVYTRDLQRRNERFILGSQAPDWILLNIQAIDGRLPMSDDALSMIAILKRYSPIIEEKGYLLWRRNDVVVSPTGEPAPKEFRTIRMGEWVAVPPRSLDTVRVAYVHTKPSVLGRIYAFWFRGAPLAMEVKTQDGTLLTWRVLPAAIESGFVLSPLLLGNHDLLDWYTGSGSVGEAASVRLVPMHEPLRFLFRDELRLAFSSVPVARPVPSEVLPDLRTVTAAGFVPAPTSREGAVRRIVEEGQPSLFMHSPASLRFALSAGQYKVNGTFGIQAAALGSPGCEVADGVRLAMYARSGSERFLLHSRDINPFAQPAERGAQYVQGLIIDLPAGAELEMAVEPGSPGANTACDWAYVRDFTFRRIRGIDGKRQQAR